MPEIIQAKPLCVAMVRGKDEEFYHQCTRNATRFGFCGSHLSNWQPSCKTPRGVPAYTHLQPSRRLTFRLISESKMTQHSWWLAGALAAARQACVDYHRESTVRAIKDEREWQEAAQANTWTCPKCGYESIHLGNVRGMSITAKQRNVIHGLLIRKVLTDTQKATITDRLESADRSWAFRTIHELLRHVGFVDYWNEEPF